MGHRVVLCACVHDPATALVAVTGDHDGLSHISRIHDVEARPKLRRRVFLGALVLCAVECASERSEGIPDMVVDIENRKLG